MNHDVFSVYEQARGLADEDIIERAFRDSRIIITSDKDFGEKIYKERHVHKGVVLLRLQDERAINKITVLDKLLKAYGSQLVGQFVVVSEDQVRFARQV